MPPEKEMAFWNRPAKSGLVRQAITFRPPAEKPERVMLAGSPPNAEMFSRTQSSALAMSSSAKLPVPPSSGQRAGRLLNPNRPRR